MKRLLSIAVAASLGVNAYLLFSQPDADSAANIAAASASDKNSVALSSPPALPPDVWALVEAGDTTSAERLRALGLPENLVRALIRAGVNERYREREKALYAGMDANYWERGFATYLYRAKDPAAALDLSREKDAELKRLLGSASSEDNPWWSRETLTFLPAEKREQLKLIEEDYRAMQTRNDQYYMIRLPEDREKQLYLEKQKRADIEAVLSPEELTQYDLRASNTANQLRWQLSGFDVSEDEYKTLFALQKPFDEKYRLDRTSIPTPEDLRARSDAQKNLDAEIKAALGEPRFAEYKRAQDQDYKLLQKLGIRLEIPPEKINEAYALKAAFQQKIREFKPAPGTDRNKQRADFQAALALEAETSYKKLLGEKGYAAVSDQIMRRLRPPSPESSTTTRAISLP